MTQPALAICATPIRHGSHKGKTATGTYAGYKRHEKRGEAPCVPCHEAGLDYKRKRRLRHLEQERERVRRYMAANPDKRAAGVARWRRRHPERNRKAKARYNAANRAQISEYRRRWCENNRDKRRAANLRRKARLQGASLVPFTAEELAERMAYWGNQCWMCGGPFEQVDHVKPVAKGGPHILSNLRPACAGCNTSKKDTWPLGAM